MICCLFYFCFTLRLAPQDIYLPASTYTKRPTLGSVCVTEFSCQSASSASTVLALKNPLFAGHSNTS